MEAKIIHSFGTKLSVGFVMFLKYVEIIYFTIIKTRE